VAVLATRDRDGTIHAVPVWFALHDRSIVLATGSRSRKVRNLELDPRATLVVHDSRPGFEVCGASLVGRVQIVRSDAARPLADAVARVDERVAGSTAVDLLAQLPNEDVDGSVAVRRAAAPHALKELVAGQHATLLAGERVDEPELGRRELRALAVDEGLDVVRIEPELLDDDRVASARLGLAHAAPRCCAHTCRAPTH